VSGGELLLVLIIALLALGPHRLPEAGGMVGNGLREFHRALNEARRAIAADQDAPRAVERPKRLID
jgi:TatA/E family protein of Tat protein translocase